MGLHYLQDVDPPWARDILALPGLKEIPLTSLQYPGEGGPHENALFGKTLATGTTFRSVRAYMRLTAQHPEVYIIASIGADVNGHHAFLAGGAAAVLFDEGLAVLAEHSFPRDKMLAFFTTELYVRYRKPAPSPGVVLLKAQIERIEGKRCYTVGTLEDGRGKVYSQAKATFVSAQRASVL